MMGGASTGCQPVIHTLSVFVSQFWFDHVMYTFSTDGKIQRVCVTLDQGKITPRKEVIEKLKIKSEQDEFRVTVNEKPYVQRQIIADALF